MNRNDTYNKIIYMMPPFNMLLLVDCWRNLYSNQMHNHNYIIKNNFKSFHKLKKKHSKRKIKKIQFLKPMRIFSNMLTYKIMDY